MNKTSRELYLAGKSNYDIYQIVRFADKIIVLIERVTYTKHSGILWISYEITCLGSLKYNGVKLPEILMTPHIDLFNISLNIDAIKQQRYPHHLEVIDNYQQTKVLDFFKHL